MVCSATAHLYHAPAEYGSRERTSGAEIGESPYSTRTFAIGGLSYRPHPRIPAGPNKSLWSADPLRCQVEFVQADAEEIMKRLRVYLAAARDCIL